MLDGMDISAYLDRIGARQPDRPDASALRELQLCHLLRVPFENLSIHLGEPIVLAEDELLDKIVRRERGGFCYELNGAFAVLLRELGYEVSMLGGGVYDSEGNLGPPFDHMALRVEAGESWLVDVGFGQHARYPLRLNAAGPQQDPEGEFTVLDAAGGDVEVRQDGTPVYRMEMRPRQLHEFARTCYWQQHSPESHFARSLTCSLPTPRGRVTLSGTKLIETVDGVRGEHELSDNEALRTYRERFGIDLDRLPLDPRA